MTAFTSSNFLIILCLVLFVLVVCLFLFIRKTATRLSKSIDLINELHKITQQQSQVIEQLLNPEKHQTNPDSIINKLAQICNQDIHRRLDGLETNSHQQVIEQLDAFRSEISAVEHKVEQLMQDDPQLKMYNRANQLAKTGASIEDIVEACQLPHAEAEVLVSLHQKSKR